MELYLSLRREMLFRDTVKEEEYQYESWALCQRLHTDSIWWKWGICSDEGLISLVDALEGNNNVTQGIDGYNIQLLNAGISHYKDVVLPEGNKTKKMITNLFLQSN